MAKKKKREVNQEKQPHIAWRIGRVVLDVLGRIVLFLLAALGTLVLVCAVAGSIFAMKLKDYLKSDVIPAAEAKADSLELDNVNGALAQTSFIYYIDAETGEKKTLQQLQTTENRVWVSYDKIPLALINATIAIEDKRFPEHNGVDWLRTLSAIANFAGGDSSYGASTITQQLIKNLTHDDDVTVNRKVEEIFCALATEKLYSKQEIMEWYLNTIYLGEGCYGVQSASRVYFGKDVSDLTTAECASLIGITNNPSLYDPYIREKNNRERQLTILKEMYDQGYIKTREEYEAAAEQELVFRNGTYDEETYVCDQCGFEGTKSQYNKGDDGVYYCPNCQAANYTISSSRYYSWYADAVYNDVLADLCKKYDCSKKAAAMKLMTGGYEIYCNYDPKAQSIVDRVYENLDNVPKTVSTQQLQSAIILIDNATGDIVAVSGGVGEKEGSLVHNRATMSLLPTGSSFKPLAVYAPALEEGIITPATVYEDSSMYDDRNWPLNDSRTYSGLCNIMRGLTQSLNTISAKTLNDLGVEKSYKFLTEKMGITSLVEKETIGGKEFTDIALAPLALGQQTHGVSVREMAQAFATFPNNGVFREARLYTKVVDRNGTVILDNAQESHTAIGEKASFYINYMLRSAVTNGGGSAAYMSNMTVAGKTGTTSSNKDRWFAGYTPYYTAVVWCGYDEPEQVILDGTWTNPAITMWKQVMEPLHENLENAYFYQPGSVTTVKICSDCGLLPEEACEKDVRGSRVVEMKLFTDDVPTGKCTCHALVDICQTSGMIANEYCHLASGNTIESVGMLIYNEDWKVNKEEDYVYNPEDKEAVCTVHNEKNVKPTEPPTEPSEPTEPTDFTIRPWH